MTQDTMLSESIEAAGTNPELDARIKKLLANRQILARILEGFVEEYRGHPIDEILNLIDVPGISIGSVAVAPGLSNLPETITAMNSEDAVQGEGTVFYDIRFTALTPEKNGKKVRMIINIEAQNKPHPGYSLVSRGIFYLARMISSQYGTEFMRKGHYEDIKKVYSIWICPNPAEGNENTVTEYAFTERSLTEKRRRYPEEKSAYDLMTVILAFVDRIHQPGEEDRGVLGTLGMLGTLLSGIHPGEKKKLLADRYHMNMHEDRLEEGVNEMCNLSKMYYADGEVKGFKEGKVEGFAEGKEEGLAEGHVKGKAEGLAEGHVKGKAEGKIEGKIEGKAELNLENAKKMLAMSAPLAMIEAVTGFSRAALQRIAAENRIAYAF